MIDMKSTLTTSNNTSVIQPKELKPKDSKQNLKKMAVNYAVILGGGAVGAASGYSVYKFYSYPKTVNYYKNHRHQILQSIDSLRQRFKDPDIANTFIYNLRSDVISLIRQDRIKLEIKSRTYPVIGAAIGCVVTGIGILLKYCYNKYHNRKHKENLDKFEEENIKSTQSDRGKIK